MNTGCSHFLVTMSKAANKYSCTSFCVISMFLIFLGIYEGIELLCHTVSNSISKSLKDCHIIKYLFLHRVSQISFQEFVMTSRCCKTVSIYWYYTYNIILFTVYLLLEMVASQSYGWNLNHSLCFPSTKYRFGHHYRYSNIYMNKWWIE